MCGITGMYAFNEAGRFHIINLQRSIDLLEHRGPDSHGSYLHDRVGLGQRRLSVIDLSPEANQPMCDTTGRYWIVFNGEIYNYKNIKEELTKSGFQFKTKSDTEVLLYAFIHYGPDCLPQLNGFFAFAVYDQQEGDLFIARDRYGIKPLYFFQDEDKFIFASELRSILSYGVEKSLNLQALMIYFQLSYIPAPLSVVNGVHKLLPGHYIRIKKKQVEINFWYQLPEKDPDSRPTTSADIKIHIRKMLERSVEQRLLADVPVGAFLSGGIDSSIITGIASGLTNHLNTFSIGFRDEPFFDETKYSRMVAKHFNTSHTEFSLTNHDLFENLHDVLGHIDEPFADSSALPVYILSKETKKHATVALSGDGADELFAGYYKHMAFNRAFHPGLKENIVYALKGLWNILPQSRNNYLSNSVRRLKRFADGFKMSPADQYWFWCALNSEKNIYRLFAEQVNNGIDQEKITELKQNWLQDIKGNMGSILKTDLQFILPNDMLYKVDLMSMAHGLEVRVPFLDHELVEYVENIPSGLKISNNNKKALLLDSFSDFLPKTILQRPKKGFEVPLLRWFRTDLNSMINDQLLNENFINDQGIFNYSEIDTCKKRLMGRSPGDVHATLWALIVFQSWWKKYIA